MTSATVILFPVRHIAKSSTPQRVAKNSVWPGKAKPASCSHFLDTGPVTTAWISPDLASATDSSSASIACLCGSKPGFTGCKCFANADNQVFDRRGQE